MDQKQNRDEKTYNDLCKRLRLEEYESNAIIFDYGDVGEHFYVILEGEVEVRIPSPIVLDLEFSNPKGVLSFIIRHFHEIYWPQINKGLTIRSIIAAEMRNMKLLGHGNDTFDFDLDKALDAFDKLPSKTKVFSSVYKLINPEDEDRAKLVKFKTVTKLASGMNFGELALQYNQARGATIKTTKKTSLASLANSDFKALIAKENRRKFKRIFAELKNYRIFKNLRPNTIVKIFHYMKKIEFKRGQTIYKEGESKVDNVYFIIDGEFEVTKSSHKSTFG